MANDPLWVPLIGHYTAPGMLHDARIRRHIGAVAPDVRQYLIAGTTGDGWAMDDDTLGQWLAVASDAATIGPAQSFIVGAFGDDAAAVIARAAMIEAHFETHPSAGHFAGLTVCAPRLPGAGQAEILAHFREILSATRAPIAIYQLPQITGCEITPETFATLARENDRIFLFKDTSGGDAVANAGLATGKARLLRGAEGDYARHLKPAGKYDGWLLSTANGFAPTLRRIANAGDERLSAALTALVGELFAAAAKLGGNAFADANRGVDHMRAYGAAWRDAPAPLRIDGSPLPTDFLAGVAAALERSGETLAGGYLR